MHNLIKEEDFESAENTNSTFVGVVSQEFENMDEKPVYVIEEE